MKKRICALLIALCLVVGLVPAVSAAEIASGTCGENLTWVLTDDGTLTISGEGSMTDYNEAKSEWYNYRELIHTIKIGNGITSIGASAFSNCDELKELIIPDTITEIRNSAFAACDGLTSVSIGKGVNRIEGGAFNFCSSLSEITFGGSAPYFGTTEDGGRAFVFYEVTATVYYPADDDSWTSYKRQDYGGNLTWVAYEPPHTHTYEEIVTAPTCAEQGYTTHTCSCGDSYIDSYTDALGHDTVTTILAPTCTEDGYTLTTCTRCDLCEYSDETEATGHDWSGAFCINCGEVRDNPFTDVPADSFYYEPVLWALENGITSGATATTFNPNGDCLRAQVVTFLWRAAGCPAPATTVNPFEDVKPSDFYYDAVLWAVENGITNGADATHFNPMGVCNRAQVVTFLHRAFEAPAVENAANPFNDVPADDWYTAPVLWAVEQGITNGLSATEFGPNTNCNRAQIVTFLYRAYN